MTISGSIIGAIKGNSRSLDYSSYSPCKACFHFIFHVLFHLIFHYIVTHIVFSQALVVVELFVQSVFGGPDGLSDNGK